MASCLLVGLTALPASAITVADSFDRPDGALSSPWSAVNSTWAVRSNKARVSTTRYASGIAYAVRSFVSANFSVSARITLSSIPRRANAGLTLLFVNDANNIFCKIEVTEGNPNGLMSTGRRRSGVTTSLLAKYRGTGFVNGGTYGVTCRRSGNVIRMTVGARTISYTLTSTDLSAFGSGYQVGLRAHVAADEDDGSSTYDDFSAVA